MARKYLTEDQKWVSFYPTFNSSFYIEKAGYFDERPEIHTSVTQLLVLFTLPLLLIQSWWFLFLLPLVFFGWGLLYIHLPIRTGIQDCESAAWGFNYHGNTIWIYIGGGGNFEGGKKWLTAYVPWDWQWVRTSTLLKDKTWFTENKRQRLGWFTKNKGYGSYEWLKENKHKEEHPYTYVLRSGKVQNRIATVGVSEMEWRWHWFKWFSPIKKISKSINIDFNDEVGEETGSWKGGCMGCSYALLPNETPEQCLRRMEKERKF